MTDFGSPAVLPALRVPRRAHAALETPRFSKAARRFSPSILLQNPLITSKSSCFILTASESATA